MIPGSEIELDNLHSRLVMNAPKLTQQLLDKIFAEEKVNKDKVVEQKLVNGEAAVEKFTDDEVAEYLRKANNLKQFLKGTQILHKAAKKGWVKTTEVLVAAGADVAEMNVSKETPLTFAVREQHLNVARFLLESKADPKIKNSSGETLLHICTHAPGTVVDLIELIKLLIQCGVGVDDQGDCQHTALWNLCSEFYWGKLKNPEWVQKIRGEAIRLLVTDYKANVKLPNCNNYTPLGQLATHDANIELVEFLKQNGATFDSRSIEDALGKSASNSQAQMLRHLLKEYHALPRRGYSDVRPEVLNSALTEAAMWGNEECVRLLIEAKADAGGIYGATKWLCERGSHNRDKEIGPKIAKILLEANPHAVCAIPDDVRKSWGPHLG